MNQTKTSNNNEQLTQICFDIDDARFRIKPYQQIASACTGAIITSLFMTPLDVIKTRLQIQQKSMLSNRCFLYCNGLMDHLCVCGPNINQVTSKTIHYNGTIDAFVKITRHEGGKSLWSGLGPTLVLALPATVIYFVCYEQLRLKFKDYYLTNNTNSKETPFSIPLLAGMLARVLSVSVVNPLELIRTKMQSQKLSYLEVGKALQSMMAHEGVVGLWKGLGPTLYRDVPFSGIYWASYESIKKFFNVVNPNFGFSFIAGASAGSIAALLTTPFDVVKTHKQIEFGEKFLYPDSTSKTTKTEISSIQALVNLFRSHGIKGIYSGVTPRLAKVAPACAIMIASFEYGKAFFHNRNVNIYKQNLSTNELIS